MLWYIRGWCCIYININVCVCVCVCVCLGTPATVNIIDATNIVSLDPQIIDGVRVWWTGGRTDGMTIKKNQMKYREKCRRRIANKQQFCILKNFRTFLRKIYFFKQFYKSLYYIWLYEINTILFYSQQIYKNIFKTYIAHSF